MVESARASQDLSRRSFERILLIKPSSLGDIVHALPVLHGLRVRYPRATIDWLIASSFAPLLEGHPQISRLVRFDRRRYGRMAVSPKIASEFFRFVRELRAARYDLVIDLQGLFRTGFLAWVGGAQVRIGFSEAREGARIFYTHRVTTPDPDMHAVDRNYLSAAFLGFQDVPISFDLALSGADRGQAAQLLGEAGVSGHESWVAVVPGARWETKVWLPERFAETIDRLQEKEGRQCLMLGAPEEVPVCERISALCRTVPPTLAGRTDVRTFAALLGLADVVLCHDSAAMHLAVAQERPTVCLIGPTNPRRTGPYRRPQDVVALPLDCAPCYLRRLSQCPYAHRCMRELPSEMVVSAVCHALAECEGSPSRGEIVSRRTGKSGGSADTIT